jgi:hypothetical protein
VRDERYSCSASGWSVIGLTAIEELASFFSNLPPRDGFYFAVFDFLDTAGDLLLPGGLHVFVNGGIQAVDQTGSEFSAFVVGEG